jgi:hypothetical protein
MLCGERPIGQLRTPDGSCLARARVLTDATGAEVARVTRVRGGAGPGGTDSAFVIDVRESTDDRLRAAALLAGVLRHWYSIPWDAGSCRRDRAESSTLAHDRRDRPNSASGEAEIRFAFLRAGPHRQPRAPGVFAAHQASHARTPEDSRLPRDGPRARTEPYRGRGPAAMDAIAP